MMNILHMSLVLLAVLSTVPCTLAVRDEVAPYQHEAAAKNKRNGANPGANLEASSDVDAVEKMQSAFDAARDNAVNVKLNYDLDLYPRKFQFYQQNTDWGKAWFSAFDWEEMNVYRLHQSYSFPSPSLVWVKDKIDQQCMIDLQINKAYVDLYANTTENNDAAFIESVDSLMKQKKAFLIKASHGANSNAIHAFCDVQAEDYTITRAKAAMAECFGSFADVTESWALRQAKPGVIAQACYESAFKDKDRPLEFKVLTVWGKVVGATLETRPKEFWVTSEGLVWEWQTDQNARGILTRFSEKGKKDADPLATDTMNFIRNTVLKENWAQMRDTAEKVATHFGFDELRVDFFVGGPEGPKINEITYGGGAARYPFSLSHTITRAYIDGYRKRETACVNKENKYDGDRCQMVEITSPCKDTYNINGEDIPNKFPKLSESLKSRGRYWLLRKWGVNLGQGGR